MGGREGRKEEREGGEVSWGRRIGEVVWGVWRLGSVHLEAPLRCISA